MNFIKGSYDTSEEALAAVEALQAKGYRAEDIRLVSNVRIRDTFMDQTDAKFTATEDYGDAIAQEQEDESLWDQIKDFFVLDRDYDREQRDPQDDPLVNYRKDIEDGKIVLIVEGKRDPSPESLFR